jgi:PadR family transcriptional regulator, regulatory protein PadR
VTQPLPSLSGKERLILELLASGSRYGLQLVDESGGRLKRGTVYVTLGRMQEKGFVESHRAPVAADADAVQRRMYRATPYGRRVLDAWGLAARRLSMEPGR